MTLRDKLSRLTYLQAVKLLGDQGKQLIQQGGKFDINIEQQVYFRGDLQSSNLRSGPDQSPIHRWQNQEVQTQRIFGDVGVC